MRNKLVELEAEDKKNNTVILLEKVDSYEFVVEKPNPILSIDDFREIINSEILS